MPLLLFITTGMKLNQGTIMHFTSPNPPARSNLLLAAILGLVGGTVPTAITGLPKTRSTPSLSKRLSNTKRTFDQWAHNMVTSSPYDISYWNAQVKRRNQKFAKKKGLA
jgi:hypothetical protein